MASNSAVTGIPILGQGRDTNKPLIRPSEGSSPDTWMKYIHTIESENRRNLNLEENLHRVREQNAQLQNQLGYNTLLTPPSSIPTPHEPRPTKLAKHPDPELFDRDRSKFQVFRSNLRMKLLSNAD